MARRGSRHEIEIVDDDTPGPDDGIFPMDTSAPRAATDDDAGAAAGRRRGRTPLLVGVGLVVALGVAGVVGQVVVDRRERATIAAVAAHPGSIDLLSGPPVPLWELATDGEYRLGDVHTPGGLLVGVLHSNAGPVAVRALDAVTGAEAWRTELLDGTGRAEVVPDDMMWSYSGACVPAGDRDELVVCMVDDRVEVAIADRYEPLPPSQVRVVTLDTRDGSVVADVADALGPGVLPTSFTAVADLMVVAVPDEAGVELVAVTPDGDVAWRTSAPTSAPEDHPEGRIAYLSAMGDTVALQTADTLHLLDAQGRTVRTEESEHSWVELDDVAQRVMLVNPSAGPSSDGDGRTGSTRLLRPEGAVEVEGTPVDLAVDDGSAPGVLLTSTAGRVVAWDEDGEELWSRDGSVEWSALLVDGRYVLDVGPSVVAVDARTGAELWSTDVTVHLPATDGRHLLALAVAPRRGVPAEMIALHPATGDEMWRAPLPEGTRELRSVHGLLVSTNDVPGERDMHLTILG